MSGGANAQKGFHYQNSYIVYKVLESLNSRNVKKIRADQSFQIRRAKPEIDLLIELITGPKQYYEIKGGKVFNSKFKDIRDSLKNLFLIYRSEPSSNFFLVVNPELSEPITFTAAQLKRFQKNTRPTKALKDFCKEFKIKDFRSFHSFCKNLTILSEAKFEHLRPLGLQQIQKLRESLALNSDHALTNDDLHNRLLIKLVDCISMKNGDIDVIEFCSEIADWAARNRIAADSPPANLNTELEAKRAEAFQFLSEKFGLSLVEPGPIPTGAAQP